LKEKGQKRRDKVEVKRIKYIHKDKRIKEKKD
jgi:hypothetical protein